jgi:hypothetical protein
MDKEREQWTGKGIKTFKQSHIQERRKILELKEVKKARLKKEQLATKKKLNQEVQNTKDKIGEDPSDEKEVPNIMEKGKYRWFRKGNKPKLERRIYSRREEKESMDK